MSLTADEIALYDRQIRLWGMATQLRLRSAKVLIINVGAVGTEIVKNLVLGGLNSIELADSATVKEEDFAAQYFLPDSDSIVGQLKLPLIIDAITALNPRVSLTTNTNNLAFDDEEYFKRFDLIIATEISKKTIFELNNISRKLHIPLYVAGLHGMFGYIFTDLVEHQSQCERDAGNVKTLPNTKINRCKTITDVSYADGKETLTIVDNYVPINQVFDSRELPSQLNRRQLRRLSAALPLIFALFDVEEVNEASLKEAGERICEKLGIPGTVITDEYVEMFVRQAHAEFAPIAAVLGGALAQDVIQFLSKKESPINNVLVLDAVRAEMPIYLL